MGRERRGLGRASSDGIGTAGGTSARGRRWGVEVGERVEGVDAVEEFQVEGGGGLAVDLGFGH